MKSLTRKPKLVTITILTAITSFVWVGYSVYQVWKKQPNISLKPEVMKEFSPNLDVDNLSKIQTRMFIEENEFSLPIPKEELEIESENLVSEEIPISPTTTPTVVVSSPSAEIQ